ncbi:hypothetical protein [Ancylobacter polymorphus]|uniref:Uncharacterized protein n=1 Tax=Ancylobacter polymorphus TaxID=223390 RepID=A0A9E6ZX02_9HYPH|nr:hypothetical protein [Ancylobacter polymorphus]UOK71682.1 hypothetical protein K9D25_02865 [Ancylobacter polymorphus]
MSMNTTDIQALIDAIPARMADKGLRQPDGEFCIRANSTPSVMLKWWKQNGISNTHYEFLRADTPAEALDKAVKFIAAMPSAEEAKRNTFLEALAKVVDLGNELGQDVGALVSEMKRLSENVITDQRKVHARRRRAA